MTAEQRARVTWFRELGYRPRILKHAAHGITIVSVPCKLSRDVIPMRVYPDGTFMPAWYDLATHRQRRAA